MQYSNIFNISNNITIYFKDARVPIANSKLAIGQKDNILALDLIGVRQKEKGLEFN